MNLFRFPFLFSGFLLLSCVSNVFAQKAKPVKIIDPGELYSTYELLQTEKDEIYKQVNPAEYEQILKYCTEESWPEGINTLDERLAHVDGILSYKIFKVAELDESFILKIPAKQNSKMKGDLKPKHDFYFIISKKGVE